MILDRLTFRKKRFGYYILGCFIILVFNQIGTIPLLLANTENITPETTVTDIIKSIRSLNLRSFTNTFFVYGSCNMVGSS